jgi:dolichol kinase
MTRGIVAIPSTHTLYRRLWHVVGGLLLIAPYGLRWMDKADYTLVLGCLLAGMLIMDLLRLRLAGLNRAIMRLLGPLLLPREVGGLNGTTFFLAGILLAVLLLPRTEAMLGALFLILGDLAAGIVGRRWGRTRPWSGGKSLEGSAACFLVSLAVALPFVGPGAAAGAALAAALIEFMELPLDDNLLIPPIAGAVLLWLR